LNPGPLGLGAYVLTTTPSRLIIYLFETKQKDPKATDTAMTAYNHSFEINIENIKYKMTVGLYTTLILILILVIVNVRVT
jgi:hypothetical protein